MSDQHDDGYEFEEQQSDFPPVEAVPPTQAGDFVPVRPPEGWPTVVGVLGVIFGGLGIVGGVCGVGGMIMMMFASSAAPPDMQDELQRQMQSSFPYPVPQSIQMLAEFALAVMLLVGGIMLLRRRPSSGGVLTAYAVLDLLSNTYGGVMGYFVYKATIAALEGDPNMQQAPPGMIGIMQSVGPVFVGIAWLGSAIWPVFLIIWFRRQKIRSAMAQWG